MNSGDWRNFSIKIVLGLFCVCILLFAFSFVSSDKITGKDLVENTDIPVGKTVYAGDSVFSDDEMIKVPVISNLGYLGQQFLDLNIQGILISLSTGAVPISANSICSEGIAANGQASGFEGPGYLTLDGENLAVKGPSNFVWGFSTPYKYLTKTEEGVDLYEGNNKLQSISKDDIKNQDFNTSNYNTNDIISWYNYDAKVGSNYTLEKGLTTFSDNRSDLSPNQIKEYFGNDVYNTTENYPTGSPVMVYMTNYTENESTDFLTGLGSYPQYNDQMRAYNAAQFCEGWNNTIIAPHSYGSGKSYIDFGTVSDGDAPSGAAAHGVCPPARTLRAAALNEGFSMPVGMTGADEAVLYGYGPCEDIKIYNDHDYPVKVIMWYTGSGTGLTLHAKIVKFIPNS
ncbi:hypothetical protein [Methanobrevibacter sp. DSM 116169]|uniref:hypothetical protein n=1 Tax=Methanobrevibacter sp. DSM 116169 TaxID=3242727 RepID=UPI0038FD0707